MMLICRSNVMMVLSGFGNILAICILMTTAAWAQLDRPTLAQLPDSLRPLDPDRITFLEAERILLYSKHEDLALEVYRANLDRLCVDFERRYRRFKTKSERLRHCQAIQNYWLSRVTTNLRMVPVFLDSARKYNARYRTLIGADTVRYHTEFADYYRHLALILYADGKFSQSYQYHLHAADLFRQRGSNRELSKVYRDIAEIRAQLQEFEEALSAVDSGMVALRRSRGPGAVDSEYLRYGQILSFKKAELYGFLFCAHRRKEDYDSTMRAIGNYWQVAGQDIYNRRNKYLTLMRVNYFAGDHKACITYADSFLLLKTKDYADFIWMTSNVYKALSYEKIGKEFGDGKWLSINWVEPSNPDYTLLLRELYLLEQRRGNLGTALRYQARLMNFKDSLDRVNHGRKIVMLQKDYDDMLTNMKIGALQERKTRDRVYFGLTMTIIALLLVIAGMERINRARKMKALVSRIEELTLLHMMRIEDEKQTERKRLGQELHDNLGGIIAASARISKALGEDSGDAKVKAGLFNIATLLEEGYYRARNQSHDLYLDKNTENFWKDITQDIDLFFFGSGITVDFQNFASTVALSAEVKTILLTTLREAITNIFKHADASRVWVLAYEDQEEIIVEIRDNGRGFVNAVASVGINSIRDRVRERSGTLTITPNTPSGSCIRVNLPVKPVSERDFVEF